MLLYPQEANMGDGSDFLDQDQGGQPSGGGGEYYGGGMAVAAPGPWGPPEQAYDPRYTNMQPQPVQYPQHQQPQAEYRGPVAAPTVQMQHRAPPRRRKPSKGMQRMYLVQYYEAVLETPLFGDPNDPYANQVQAEVVEFAQRRIDELLGEVPEKGSTAGLEPQEVQVLKALARKMLEPETEEPQEAPPLPPSRERIAEALAPDVQEAQEASQEAPAPPAPVQRPPAPPRPAQAPPQQARPTGPQQPPRPPQPQREMPRAPQMGPRVIARPTPAQRQALDAQRQAPPSPPPQRPVYQPQPQMAPVYAPPPPAPEPARRRGKRGQAAPAAPTAAPGPPPPLRYAMPMGEGMTAISAMKAEAQIQAGGTVLSQTFVKSAAGR